MPPGSRGNVFPRGFPLRTRVLASGQQRERIPAESPHSRAGACLRAAEGTYSRRVSPFAGGGLHLYHKAPRGQGCQSHSVLSASKCPLWGPSLLHTFPRCSSKVRHSLGRTMRAGFHREPYDSLHRTCTASGVPRGLPLGSRRDRLRPSGSNLGEYERGGRFFNVKKSALLRRQNF